VNIMFSCQVMSKNIRFYSQVKVCNGFIFPIQVKFKVVENLM
jgi:hypothetical protein